MNSRFSRGTQTTRISIIVPCWREAYIAVRRAADWAGFDSAKEVVLAGLAGCGPPLDFPQSAKLHWCASLRASRGEQMNLGASKANGEILLFHHVDSELTPEHIDAIVQVMSDRAVIGGGFYRKFDQRHPALRWLEPLERIHNRAFGTIYGDQSVFVRRAVFEQLGGFAPIPLMEDVEFSKRLRRAGKVVLLDPAMRSSPQSQIEQGVWRVTLRNLLFLIAFRCGISADRLHCWYYGRELVQPAASSSRITSEISAAE
ncbi:MAG: hypothetical protein DLM52_08530 [Chthoniobacterales bacterium]|nr:MAG: hypothetical protein DLM52_08530 [Chthoniobacterales bacterium]